MDLKKLKTNEKLKYILGLQAQGLEVFVEYEDFHKGKVCPSDINRVYAAWFQYEYVGFYLAWFELSGLIPCETVFYLRIAGVDNLL